MATLAERQDAMRVKFRARRNKRLAKQLAKVKAPRPKRVIVIRACAPKRLAKVRLLSRVKAVAYPAPRVQGDISTAKLDRMELLAYRIARRKWQIA